MDLIDISIFKGEVPKLSKKLLPVGNAASAINCDLESGNLQPIKNVSAIQDASAMATSIHKMSGGFLQWNNPVNVVESLIADSGERIILTGDGYPKETNAALSLVSPPFPTNTRRLGIPSPTNALTITMNGTAGDDIVHSSSYVYTIVGKWEDGSVVESAPSKPTAVFDVYSGITPQLTGFVDSIDAGAFTTHFRIYRLNSGNTGAAYQYVDEITILTSQYDDVKTDAELGEVLPTIGWASPDDALFGLIATSYGMVFGFKGNSVYPSETFHPYAFPAAYRLTTETDIVGAGYTGSLVVVLTKTVPYLLVGQNPETLALKRLGYQQKCVSARSIVNVPGGVIYASPDGLFQINETGIGTRITKNILTKKQWKALGPENLFSFYYDDFYIGFFSGTTSGFRINLETGEYNKLITEQNIYGGEYSSEDDLLYLIQTKDAVREIVSFDTGSYLDYEWLSKKFVTVSKIKYTSALIQGDFTQGPVTFSFYVDDALVFLKSISNENIFRIGNSKKGQKFQIKLTGKATVDRVMVGRSVPEVVKNV